MKACVSCIERTTETTTPGVGIGVLRRLRRYDRVSLGYHLDGRDP
jgi:hypothetical protein